YRARPRYCSMIKGPDATAWTDARQILGLEFEIRAGKWLTRRGWRIEAHRFRLGHNDLDLIVRQGHVVAFVEVKARRTDVCAAPEEAIGKKKRQIIQRLAWAWILRYGAPGDQYRFDVIAIAGIAGKEKIRHFPDAWRPGWR